MESVILILPYFGKFKSYFSLFIQSCAMNPEVKWLLVTDNELDHLPPNMIVKRMCFEELKALMRAKLDFEFRLEEPYKLCDFRPLYGEIFSDEILGYDYWGYCDCDLIFGDLKKFLSPIFEQGYDKIFAAGHLTIYKNENENNRRYKKLYRGESQLERVFQNRKNTGFDEAYYNIGNIHQIFLEDGAKVFDKDYSANPAVCREQFYLMKYDADHGGFVEQPYRKTMYIWDHGRIRGLYAEDRTLKEEEYIYMHFQNRNMQMVSSTEDWEQFYIVPNCFIPLTKVPTTVDEWLEYQLEPKNSQLNDVRKQVLKHKLKRLKEILLCRR